MMMSDEGLDKGLKLLLKQAYDRPEPDECFRSELLQKLRGKQVQVRAVRRRKLITLYTTCATAAAAAVVISFVPLSQLSPISAPVPVGNFTTASAIPASADPTPTIVSGDFSSHHAVQRSLLSGPAIRVQVNESAGRSYSPYAATIPVAASGRPVVSEPVSAPISAGSVDPAALASLDGQSAHAMNAIDIRATGKNDWTSLKPGSTFTLKNGMEIRTPVGMAEPATVAVKNGAMLMLDGMSQVQVGARDLRMQDGRAVISLAHSKLGLELQLAQESLALQPGALAFLRVDEDDDYAKGGAPAPVLVLLKGQALPLAAEGQVNKDAHVLTSNKVYEIYNTGTGRYPNRELGSYESQQRFQPMINAITATNEY